MLNTPSRVKFFDSPSVWLEFSPLAQYFKSVNLGQGFPDWAPPQFVQDFAKTSVEGGHCSTYARSAGHPKLIKVLAEHYEKQLNHKIIPEQEILVTVGASEALFLAIMSFVDVGDEVIVIEPGFDLYYGALKMAQANIKTVSLTDSLEMNWDKLNSLISDKTKMLILNTPHNPSGKVFNKDELTKLSKILDKAPNCVVLSDEVYEHLVYDESKHISIASVPGMYERTITVSSAGKTFSTTGWKVGWTIGPEQLIKRLQLCQQWVVFSVSKPHQEAIADSLVHAKKHHFYKSLKQDYLTKRDLLYTGLKELGLNPILPQGSFFILCDISDFNLPNKKQEVLELDNNGHIHIDHSTLDLHDYNFCRALTMDYGVAAIPTSAFYLNKNENQKWARFAFCKDETTLNKALKSLKDLTKS